MAQINVVAVLKAKEGREGDVIAAFGPVLDASRKDKGCVRYDLFQADGSPSTLVMLETWESQEDLDEHMKSPALASGFGAVGDAFDGAPQLLFLKPVNVA
jgi:quinol monooxygenase YgiN